MKPMNSLRCVWTLAGVLLAGGLWAAGEEEVLAEASTAAGVVLDNAATKTALDSESLVLPAAWGANAAGTLKVEGGSAGLVSGDTSPDAETYDWDTAPLLPGTYALTLVAGGETYTATYLVAAAAVAEWGTLSIDNGTTAASGGKTYLADGESETLVLPAAWGETVEGEVTVTVTGANGTGSAAGEISSDSETCDWATGPLMPGMYDVTLAWNGQTYTATYVVPALAEAALVGDGAATIDNAMDANGVRQAASASTTFNVVWPGLTGSVTVSRDGKDQNAVPSADGSWEWKTNGLVRGTYTFTHVAGGATETAKFYLDSDLLGVIFGEDAVLPVPAEWYVANVSETIPDEAADVSDSLKASAQNGHAYWKNYVLGWNPSDATVALLARVVDVDAETGAASVRLTGMNPPMTAFGDLALKYRLYRADSETAAFTAVGDAQDAAEFTDAASGELSVQQRFYRPAAVLERK